nr:NAD(+) synthase [Elusimicrobiota bacterium]
ASIVINSSASPFFRGKSALRRRILSGLARRTRTHIIYANQYGANDELIFDGNSFALTPSGSVAAAAASFSADLLLVDTGAAPGKRPAAAPEPAAEIRDALTLGIRDYFSKLGFSKAVLGVSGGIDSAVVAALAVRALGADNVAGVMMPSGYTSRRSVRDSEELAGRLGMELRTIPITSVYRAYLDGLGRAGKGVSLAMQNLQARSRGAILMALANENGWLALATGNKSEIAVGYCTLYGDTVGALAPIADLFKTDVYGLAACLNAERPVIPDSIISRAPSAELKPAQRDQDDLPEYEVLDGILRLYLEENRSPAEIAARGYPRELVSSVLRRVEANEYKRKQLAVALKVTEKSFGYGRKMPIVKSLGFLE